MLPIELRIDRVRRLLRMLEEDAPLLALRLAPLSAEHQTCVKTYAEELAACTRAEIVRLMAEMTFTEANEPAPAAD